MKVTKIVPPPPPPPPQETYNITGLTYDEFAVILAVTGAASDVARDTPQADLTRDLWNALSHDVYVNWTSNAAAMAVYNRLRQRKV